MSTVMSVPTVVLLDIHSAGRSGLEGIDLIDRRRPSTRIVMVSAHDQAGTVETAVARGVFAFLKAIGSRLGPGQHIRRGNMKTPLAVLGAARRTQAILKARQLGLIS